MNKYDENKVLRSVARVASINGNHIILKADAVVGIHMVLILVVTEEGQRLKYFSTRQNSDES